MRRVISFWAEREDRKKAGTLEKKINAHISSFKSLEKTF